MFMGQKNIISIIKIVIFSSKLTYVFDAMSVKILGAFGRS